MPCHRVRDPHYRDTTDSAIAHLLIEIAADGGVAEALGVVVGALGVELEQILAAAKISRDPDSLEAFLYGTIGGSARLDRPRSARSSAARRG